MSIQNTLSINWSCNHTWLQASKNTSWCLLGCCIGDFGTIAFFQFTEIAWPVLAIMSLAIINGILTSIALETYVLSRQMSFNIAFKTAIGMSLVSMISMDLSVAASSFLIFILYKFWKKPKKLLRYIIPLFLVGFSLSLPLYLYDNEKL